LMKTNQPTVGDKFFFAHGQKGTINEVRPAVEMPWFDSGPMAGQSPDLIIGVPALARVTQGLLLELLWGKARAMSPVLIHQYQNIFMSEMTFREKERMVSAVLQSFGMSYRGKEQMRLPDTGAEIQCKIYNGIGYLRVLKQMARDKLRSRDRGPTNELTRQTSTGRKNYGGIKGGEMENWNFFCYGMSMVFQNFNRDSADKFLLFQCTKCNIPAIGNLETNLYLCLSCKSSEHIVRLPNCYITNLTFQELYAAGFGHTIIAQLENSDIVMDEERLFDQYRRMAIV
jgi:DNA-directed RNA polymerase II subunit RPB2